MVTSVGDKESPPIHEDSGWLFQCTRGGSSQPLVLAGAKIVNLSDHDRGGDIIETGDTVIDQNPVILPVGKKNLPTGDTDAARVFNRIAAGWNACRILVRILMTLQLGLTNHVLRGGVIPGRHIIEDHRSVVLGVGNQELPS